MSSHLRVALASIQCFTDDGTLDVGEINFLLGLARADGQVDDDEKRVLSNIFNKVNENQVDRGTWKRIQEVKKDLEIQ